MKSELLIIAALAAALMFHRSPRGTSCGPSGCLLLAPDCGKITPALMTGAGVKSGGEFVAR